MKNICKYLQVYNEPVYPDMAVSTRRYLLSNMFIIYCTTFLVLGWWESYNCCIDAAVSKLSWLMSNSDILERLYSFPSFADIISHRDNLLAVEFNELASHYVLDITLAISLLPAIFSLIILVKTIFMVVKKQVTSMFAAFAIVVSSITILSLATSLGILGLSIEYHFDGRFMLTDIIRCAVVTNGLLFFLYCAVYIPLAKHKGWQY